METIKNGRITGVVYTPEKTVEEILDMSGFTEEFLKNNKDFTVMDLACGEGAFLTACLRRWLNANKGNKNIGFEDIYNIFRGVDIDEEAINTCIDRMASICSEYGFDFMGGPWNIYCGNALAKKKNKETYTFVFCNPPYIDIHDMTEKQKELSEKYYPNCKNLYFAFYKLGMKICFGTMAFITPREWFTGIAAKELREDILKSEFSMEIKDFREEKVFPDAEVLSEITILKKDGNPRYIYRTEEFVTEGAYEDLKYEKGWFFVSKEEEKEFLDKILSAPSQKDFVVKNGCATLLDKVFLSKKPRFDGDSLEIPFRKATKKVPDNIYYGIFPYNKDGEPLSEEEIKTHTNIYNYLLSEKEQLEKRKTDADFWLFGRTQALKDVYRNKLAVNYDGSIIPAEAGKGVFSGLYIVAKNDTMDYLDFALTIISLFDEDYNKYRKLIGRLKAGSYYVLSSKDIQKYIDYKLSVKNIT